MSLLFVNDESVKTINYTSCMIPLFGKNLTIWAAQKRLKKAFGRFYIEIKYLWFSTALDVFLLVSLTNK